MCRLVTTFMTREDYERGRLVLDALELPYEVVSPDPGFGLVGAPALIVEGESRLTLSRPGGDFFCAGWVEYRKARIDVPRSEPETFDEGVFGRAAAAVLAPCVADRAKIRIIAQLSGDVGSVLSYLNAEMDRASFNPQAPVLTFMKKSWHPCCSRRTNVGYPPFGSPSWHGVRSSLPEGNRTEGWHR